MKILLVFFLCTTFIYATQEFEDVYIQYKTGNYRSSLEAFRLLADKGDLEAAHILARMYERGEGCEVNEKEAFHYYKIASTGYYNRSKDDFGREVDKKRRILYESFKKPADKETEETIRRHSQSLYNLKAYKANYFFPLSYRYNGNYPPTNGHDAQSTETEFQISIRYDFMSNLLGFNEIYTVAYTQLSFWQLYNESAYFRETNYNPEFFVTIPSSALYDNDYIKAFKFSFAHQSNGRGGVEERSWNYLSASTFFQYKSLFTELKIWKRLPDSTDYNPKLIDYMGHGHIKFTLPYKQHMGELLLRNNFHGKSATQLSYTYPVFNDEDLFLYVKYFNGYGESLIDYNNNINKIGIGFSISR